MRKYSNQSSIEGSDKPNQSTDENMINSLCKRFYIHPSHSSIDKGVVPANDEKSETSSQRPNIYTAKLGSGKVLKQVMTYEFSDSEGSSPKKGRASPPLFDNVFKGNTEPTSGDLPINSKDEMESPTFARNNEAGMSPNFKITSKSSSEFENKPFTDSPLKQGIQIQSVKSEKKKAKAEKKAQKEAHNQKVHAMLEDYKNRKAQSGASLNGMNSLTTINDALNRSKTMFINYNEKDELFGNEFERLDSDGFRDDNGNFHQDLEPPTSFLELDRSGTNVLETLRTRNKTPFEFENYQIAEPISLISADKSSSQKISTEESPIAQTTPTRPPNIEPISLKRPPSSQQHQQQQSKNSSAKQSPRLMLQQKQIKQVKHQMSLQPTTKTNTTTESAYTKILSRKSIKTREVELALTYDNNNNPIIQQKSSELKARSQEPAARRETSPKKKVDPPSPPRKRIEKPEPQSPARKRLYKNTESSAERNQTTPVRKVGSATVPTTTVTLEKKIIPKSAASKVTSIIRDSKVSTPMSTPQANSPLRSPETSPRVKPVYAKIIGRNKSPSAGSSQTAFPTNNNNNKYFNTSRFNFHPPNRTPTNNNKQPEHNKSKSLGKPALSIDQQPTQQNSGSYAQNALRQKSPSGYANRIDINRTPTRSTKRSNDESTKRAHKDSLQDYLTEDSITPSEAELKNKNFKLNLKEENMKPTTAANQEKTGSLKHFRYPSFGRGGLEKEVKQLSTRRTISQEAQLPEITEVSQTPFSPTEQIGGPQNTQATQEDLSKDYTPVVRTNQSIRSEMKRIDRGARKEPKIAYSSLMKSLELRKNIQNPANPPLTIDTKPSVYDLSQVSPNLLDPTVDFLSPSSTNNMMQSIYSGSSVDGSNKKLIDIYERNSRWLANKDDKIQGMASVKNKQELQDCTFKPAFQKPPLSNGTGYNSKNFYTPMAARLQQASQSPERSFSREKKAFTSYREISDLKKEINAVPPKANHRYYSPKSRFHPAVGKAEV